MRDLDDELAALGGDARARAREIDLLRYQVEEIAAARLDDPAEDVALEAEELLLADAVAHRERAHRRVRGARGPGVSTRSAGRSPRSTAARRSSSWPTACAALQGELADVEQELRHEVDRVDDDPERVDAVRARRHQLHELGRKYGYTLADVIAYGAESASRLDELEALRGAGRRARGAPRATTRRRRSRPPARSAAARRDAAAPLARAIEVHLRELAMPHAVMEVRGRAGRAAPTTAHDRVVYLLARQPG